MAAAALFSVFGLTDRAAAGEEQWYAQEKPFYSELYVPMSPEERSLQAEIVALVARARINISEGTIVTPMFGKQLISVKIASDGVIAVNLNRTVIPSSVGPATIEERLNDLGTLICIHREEKGITCGGVLFFFSGQTLSSALHIGETVVPARRSTPMTVAGKTVLISAGHGYYYHYRFGKWVPQRDAYNGVTEDFVTPNFADRLAYYLKIRSHANPILARNRTLSIDPESNKTWRLMASRYNVKDILPKNAEIWNSYSKSHPTVVDREHTDDIYTRPLYGNHLNSTALLSIHTNAQVSGSTATGTRIYYQNGRADSESLAKSVYCYIKEQYKASEKYTSFTIARPVVNNLAETRLSSSPAVLVESAFHTNPLDAAAIKDAEFRDLVAKGIEKGWRLFAEGEGCEPFSITSIPAASGPHNQSIPVNVNYAGFPEFAVEAEVSVVSCPAGWTCTGGKITFEKKRIQR